MSQNEIRLKYERTNSMSSSKLLQGCADKTSTQERSQWLLSIVGFVQASIYWVNATKQLINEKQ